MACQGRTGGLGNERDFQVTDGDLGHGVCVHLLHGILGLEGALQGLC